MERFRILVSCDLGSQALERFNAEGDMEVACLEINDEDSLSKALPGYHALIVRSNVKVTKKALESAEGLLVVGRAGMGTDNIDLDAATRLGIAVVNAPGGNAVTTAEHTVALLMSLARNIPRADRSMRAGLWEKKKFMGRELSGKTLGIIGAGRIGGGVAKRAGALGMRVLALDPFLNDERAMELGVACVGPKDLFSMSDFISLHTPLTEETRGLINKDTLKLCKKGMMLINCARGPLVDQDALYDAIISGQVAGAALDVYPAEPPSPHPLYKLDEVVMTPHLGASTHEAQESVALETAENVISYLRSGTAQTMRNASSSASESGTLAPYLSLASTLGRFLSQAVDGPVDKVTVTGFGDTAGENPAALATAAVLGLLSGHMSERVNQVNALVVAADRGITVTWGSSSEARDFVNMVGVELGGGWGVKRAEGALLGKKKARLVSLDDFRLEAKPAGNMVLIYNRDVPGVIGAVGEKLGELSINISSFYNGRVKPGGDAMTLVNVDGEVSDEALGALAKLPAIKSVKRIVL